MLSYSGQLKQRSRELRKNMTDAEKLVWSKVRGKQPKDCQFYRQKVISNYIVDFYCPRAKLVIEIDGGRHYMSDGKQKDTVRDSDMNDLGLRVLRFSNREVSENIDGVVEVIFSHL